MLVDRGDPQRSGRCRIHMVNGTTGDGEPAVIRGLRPGDDLDEGRLAGAVLADERVNLSGAQVEGYAAQRAHAREGLGDARGF